MKTITSRKVRSPIVKIVMITFYYDYDVLCSILSGLCRAVC